MKTVTKTFYVSDESLKMIKTDIGLIGIYENKNSLDKNQIQISWQEEERKIEISESEFDEIMDSVEADRSSLIFREVIRQKLFGNREV